eukprot:8876321-Lingulodinium_polyedra.AAC.1
MTQRSADLTVPNVFQKPRKAAEQHANAVRAAMKQLPKSIQTAVGQPPYRLTGSVSTRWALRAH